jgi:predicted nucleic acid-binding protein
MIFVDTNVLVDVAQQDPIWGDWSQRQLDAAAAVSEVAINDVVYAELAVGYRRRQDLDAMIERTRLRLAPIPRTALFVAGKAYQRYRLSGGTKTNVLPDFFIGAQAFVADAPLLTRDVRRYRRYFPDLALITPQD